MTAGNGHERSDLPARMFESGTEWLRGKGPSDDVVLSSRVRLARNLAGMPFVHRSDTADLRHVIDTCRPVLAGLELGERTAWVDVSQLSKADISLLLERHLVSAHLAKGKPPGRKGGSEWPRAVAVGVPGETASVMVNEEDHLRIQAIRSGFALREAWEAAESLDDRIEAEVDYAFNPRLGYLTACPTNVGTGIRLSVMLHLPGLRMTGEINKVKRAADDMSLAVRGFYGEGSDSSGDFCQLSNQTTLGKSEQQLLDELEHRIVPEIIEYERQSRQQLLQKRQWQIEDGVHRAFGVLRHSRLLSTEEAMKLLSVLRLGSTLKLVEGIDTEDVHQLMLAVQPAHLQRIVGREIGQEERRQARAKLVRERLGGW